MQEEIDALERNGTWELVPSLLGAKPVGNKWVFNAKFQVDGSIERYKTRLVAKGFTHILIKDYNATFAPMIKLTTVRLLISLVAFNSCQLHQLDVKNAFLNDNLDETIYMDLLPSFYAEGGIFGKVCHLQVFLRP